MNRTIRKPYILVLTVLALISVVLAGVTLAKYVSTFPTQQQLITPEQFFFTASFEHGGAYLFPENQDFLFDVRNHDGVGNINASDITYSVTVNGTPLDIGVNGTIAGETKTAQTITIPASMLVAGNSYDVEITSSSPYVKTISFTVKAVDHEIENSYSVKDNGNWVQVDIFIGTNPPASVEIVYGALAPDNLHPLMTSWLISGGSGTISTLTPYTHTTLIFFGTDDVQEVNEQPLVGNNCSITLPTTP